MEEENQKNSEIPLKSGRKKYVRVARYEKKCPICGKMFTTQSEKGEFCSRACQYQSRKRRRKAQEEAEKLQEIQQKKAEQAQEQAQIMQLQAEQAQETTDNFVAWCQEHPLIVAGALILGGIYLQNEAKSRKKQRKKGI